MEFKKIPKLSPGDKVAILSPSFAAPGVWPHVYELGLKRLKEIFELEPVEYPSTKKVGASKEDRSKDLIDAFENKEIKGIISTLGGDDQVTYIKNLPSAPFANNPKPYFGYSDNTHFMNHLWLAGIPSYYGGALFTQFAMQGHMDDMTIKYLKYALFETKEVELENSPVYNDIGLPWQDETKLNQRRTYEKNDPWYWDGQKDVSGITWGGCVESIDEILRHGIRIPDIEEFNTIVLLAETSEEIPTREYVMRVFRALGERGILERVQGILVGRPKTWEFSKQFDTEKKKKIKENQRTIIIETVRKYNSSVPIIQNIDFGHTDPQICIPYGGKVKILSSEKKIFAEF